jgi:hypothetical protein
MIAPPKNVAKKTIIKLIPPLPKQLMQPPFSISSPTEFLFCYYYNEAAEARNAPISEEPRPAGVLWRIDLLQAEG